MAKPQLRPKCRHLVALEREWLRRYGEPPAITADANLLARIMRTTPAPERGS